MRPPHPHPTSVCPSTCVGTASCPPHPSVHQPSWAPHPSAFVGTASRPAHHPSMSVILHVRNPFRSQAMLQVMRERQQSLVKEIAALIATHLNFQIHVLVDFPETHSCIRVKLWSRNVDISMSIPMSPCPCVSMSLPELTSPSSSDFMCVLGSGTSRTPSRLWRTSI